MRMTRGFLRRDDGAVLLEFVLSFPILLVLFFFIVQFAYIMITWQVVHYAAYMSARSAMTCNNTQRKSTAERVAKRILAVVSASPADSKEKKDRADDKYVLLDGWGRLPNTKYLDKQVEVDIPFLDIDPRGVKCTVKFKMFLNVPVAGRIISFFVKDNKSEEESKWEEALNDQQRLQQNPALLAKYANELEVDGGSKSSEKLKYPYITLSSSSVIVIPYATKFYPLAL
jgi:hypothetical protein